MTMPSAHPKRTANGASDTTGGSSTARVQASPVAAMLSTPRVTALAAHPEDR
jgi:hypothetical protein